MAIFDSTRFDQAYEKNRMALPNFPTKNACLNILKQAIELINLQLKNHTEFKYPDVFNQALHQYKINDFSQSEAYKKFLGSYFASFRKVNKKHKRKQSADKKQKDTVLKNS